jgi:hypothetical protein
MSSSEPFNTLGGYSVGIPPELVIDSTGNVVNNVNAPNANVTANRVFANAFLYANGNPLSIGAAGSNTQVQYNNAGLLGASSAFTFNSATNLLTVTKLQVGSNANLGNVANVVILGGTNGYFLQTDGAGNLTWAPAGNGGNTGNGTPGGANTQVQFNDAGQFGGDAGFTYNKVSNTLSVANTISSGNAITGVNLAVTDATIYNTLSVTDVIASNITLSANITNANWINASYFAGNGYNLFGLVGANVTGQVGFANVANNVAGANVSGTVGFANVANSVAGANVTGQVANALVAGTVYTAAQPNITSVGNLTSLTVVGNTTLGNQVVSNYFIGNLFGTANLARYVTFATQPNITSVGTLTSLTVSGNTTLGNTASANYFVGNLYGVANSAVIANTANFATLAANANYALVANISNFTGFSNNANFANVAFSVDGSNVSGQVANALVAGTVYTNAQPNITSVGTLTSLSVTGNVSAGNVSSNFIGNGSRLSNLTGANVTGVVANANYAAFANIAQTTNVSIHSTTANTVVDNAQPNITSVGTLTNLSVAGNVNSGNLYANSGTVRGNVILGTILTASQPNITSVGTLINLAVTGNVTAGNVNAGNLLTANFISGTLTTNAQQNINYLGNVGWLNVDTAIPNSNGNIRFNGSMSGVGLGSNITITGNLNAGNYVEADVLIGSLSSSSQPNITTVGNLTSLTVVGTTNLGDVSNVTILGGNANYVLSTDGTGNLSWVEQSGGGGGNGNPGGLNTQIQFNDNGSFGGDGSFTWNKNTNYLSLGGNANITGTLNVFTTLNAVNLNVTGDSYFSGNILGGNVTGNLNVANLTTTGTANFTGNTTLANTTLNAITTVPLTKILTINGNLNANTSPNVTLGTVGNIRIFGGNNGYVLTTDGAGNLSWAAGGGGGGNGTPGGSNTQIQFNDAGAFGGSVNLTYNKVTNEVNVTGNLVANSFQMGSGIYQFSKSNVYFATTNSTSSQVLLSIDANDLAAVDLTIISDDNTIRNFIKISAVVKGSVVNYAEYSTLPVNGYTGDFAVQYDAGNVLAPASVQLVMTPQSGNLMTHRMQVTTYYVT